MSSRWDDPAARRHLLDTWFAHHRQVYGGEVQRLMESGEEEATHALVRQRQVEADHLFWAVDALTDLHFDDPAALLPFILDVVERNDGLEDGLDTFAAGPLEDYLCSEAAIDGLPQIEHLAATNPRMRMMLEGVWIERRKMNPDVYDRCRALGCVPLDTNKDDGDAKH